MGNPKKQTSQRKKGLRRSHLVLTLARKVNSLSPVKTYTTKRESGKKLVAIKKAGKAS
jgi:ribosomal protein L32